MIVSVATTDAKRRDNRRGRILDAAAVEFARSGYSATSVRDIAAAAGILPGSMYYHFASKEDLLAAVHAAGIRRIKERVLAAIETATIPGAGWRPPAPPTSRPCTRARITARSSPPSSRTGTRRSSARA